MMSIGRAATDVIRELNESGGGASAGGGTGGQGFLATITPFLLIGLGIAIVVIGIAAAVIVIRTRSAVAPQSSAAAAADGWWTCTNCGAGNMDAAPRCHACNAWRATRPRPTPTPQP
jgi:hypothetical protein